ncbi:Twin-arginine translocation protein TatC [hydrothermal vent metagenome]|uniref:Twin-arginine translocation protein TatC n=1 Tax=hydrothermal vent metagenome TaxID=652676 RepID=A0A3B1D7V7_9ZZZZ
MKKSPNEFSFIEHLDDLRGRLIKIILAMIIASCLVYGVIDYILAFLIQPVGQLVFTSPADAFLARITLALFVGFFLSFPVILYQIWSFVSEGLRPEEKKFVYFFAPCSFFLFLLGVGFAYFVTIPIAIRFLLSFSTDAIIPMITIRNYISFLGTMLLAFGVVFELPLVLLFLTKIGVATPAFFSEKRRYAIVCILIVSAVITPPDIITQLIMAGPLIILYEIGIIVSKMTYKGKRDE